jgi:guanylate kinase
LIFIVSAAGGVGKDTLVRRVLADDPSLSLSRSWTTRAPRPGETDDDYRFATREEFLAEVERGAFLEWAEYLGNLYGTPLPDPSSPTDVILVIEVQGAAQVLDKVPRAVMILVVPPSREAQAARLQARGDSHEQVERRLVTAPEEEARGRELAHHVVVNDDVSRAVAEVAGILASHRKTP